MRVTFLLCALLFVPGCGSDDPSEASPALKGRSGTNEKGNRSPDLSLATRNPYLLSAEEVRRGVVITEVAPKSESVQEGYVVPVRLRVEPRVVGVACFANGMRLESDGAGHYAGRVVRGRLGEHLIRFEARFAGTVIWSKNVRVRCVESPDASRRIREAVDVLSQEATERQQIRALEVLDELGAVNEAATLVSCFDPASPISVRICALRTAASLQLVSAIEPMIELLTDEALRPVVDVCLRRLTQHEAIRITRWQHESVEIQMLWRSWTSEHLEDLRVRIGRKQN